MIVKPVKQKNIIFIFSLIFIIICGLFFFPEVFFSQKKETPHLLDNNGKGVFDLSAHWSQGNIVALIRHVERCDQSENQCLERKTGITVVGKKMAMKLGEDFKTFLNLDNTTIYNSPVKRTAQTAKFMFGDASTDIKWLDGGCKENLLKDIFNYKEDGKNLILITHSECIMALHDENGNGLIKFNVRNAKAYGSVIFIAVNKQIKQAYVLGYLYPEDWPKLLSQGNARNLRMTNKQKPS